MHPVWSYPLAYADRFLAVAGERDRQAMLMAVARQESHFDADALSSAGALGLMQLMPATAEAMAERLGLPFSTARVGYDAGYNMQLGNRYLDELLLRYDGALALVAAGYNAGPPRVVRWIERHGDPRGLGAAALIDWIELIPFRETRNYVQRIIEGYRTYDVLLDPDRPIAPENGFTPPPPEPKPEFS